MNKRTYAAILVVVILSALLLAFIVMTGPVFYDQEPDSLSLNRDKSIEKQRPFKVDQEKYPFESNWFLKDGAYMHYIDEGEGIPVVLCHGNPEWSFIYRDLIKELSGECRLIAYDLPGFGFSEAPEGFGFTPQDHVEWISALLFDYLQLDEFIIVVQDWGGPTGLSVATENPEKVLGAVISNTFAWKAEGSVKIFSYIGRSPIVQRLIINKNFFATTVVKMFMDEESRNTKSITDSYAMQFPTPESRRGAAEFPKQVTLAASWLDDLEGRLPVLKDKPIEFIFGHKDILTATPEFRARWQAIYPHAPVQDLPEVNHFTQEESPESFAIAIRRILGQVRVAEL